jgi:hypothetical protein
MSCGAENTSRKLEMTFHSLDSFVWEYLNSGMNTKTPQPVNLADIYYLFCKCPLLAKRRQHSSSGKDSKERYYERRRQWGVSQLR